MIDPIPHMPIPQSWVDQRSATLADALAAVPRSAEPPALPPPPPVPTSTDPIT